MHSQLPRLLYNAAPSDVPVASNINGQTVWLEASAGSARVGTLWPFSRLVLTRVEGEWGKLHPDMHRLLLPSPHFQPCDMATHGWTAMSEGGRDLWCPMRGAELLPVGMVALDEPQRLLLAAVLADDGDAIGQLVEKQRVDVCARIPEVSGARSTPCPSSCFCLAKVVKKRLLVCGEMGLFSF